MKVKILKKAFLAAVVVLIATSFVIADEMDPYGSPPAIENGYRLWKSQDGEWHIRMKSNDKKIGFKGSILCVGGGRIKNAWAVKMEGKSDHGSWNDREITFHFKTNEGKDGIDWVGNCRAFEFDLYMNGEHRPNKVNVGNRGKNPYAVPFQISNGR